MIHNLISTSPSPKYTGLRVVGTHTHESPVELNLLPPQTSLNDR